MAYEATSLLGSKKIGIEFTDKPVTPWGGLTLFSGLARQIGLEQAIREALPFKLTSPNATDPVEIMLAFMAGVLTGSRRFTHVERLRWDEGVRQILGLNRFVSDTTLARFFRRFTSGTVTQVFESLMRWQLGLIALNEDILDLDSSIMERYGKQEGAYLGFNPKKHRRPSHPPLIATLGKRPWVVHSWLRSGNTTSASNAEQFLEEALAMLPSIASIRYLRADSGFGVDPFLTRVEDKKLIYTVAARFTRGLKNLTAGVTDWRELEPGIEVSEVMFQAHGWKRSRRVVLIRQRAKDRDFVRGKELFDDPAYLYQGITTNRVVAPEVVWLLPQPCGDRDQDSRAQVGLRDRRIFPEAILRHGGGVPSGVRDLQPDQPSSREDRPARLPDARHATGAVADLRRGGRQRWAQDGAEAIASGAVA
jgi:hypothetical protein